MVYFRLELHLTTVVLTLAQFGQTCVFCARFKDSSADFQRAH